jgi:DNA adenine methylase
MNIAEEKIKNEIVKSPLNYIGGKYKILPQILPLLPKNINIFVDLFAGGCNVGINVKAHKIIFNDNLTYLINFYKTIHEQDLETTLNHIKNRIEEFNLSITNEIAYKKFRDFYNKTQNPLDLFVLIAYSFNHQIRFNNNHQFNNPFGRNRSSFNATMKYNLEKFIIKLKTINAEFTNLNFDDFDFNSLSVQDFVYADPPYLITTGTYNDGKRGFTGWNEQEEKKLLKILNELDNRNIKFALSNVLEHKGKTNYLLLEWIDKHNFTINYIKKNYANSNYQTKNRQKNASVEVLITNYKPYKPATLF